MAPLVAAGWDLAARWGVTCDVGHGCAENRARHQAGFIIFYPPRIFEMLEEQTQLDLDLFRVPAIQKQTARVAINRVGHDG